MTTVTTAAPATPPYASASLYVGDLQPEITEALLFEIFNAVGPVVTVRVCRDSTTRRSLGYAYVNFHRVDDAERALDTMNFKNIRNRPCRIMWSHRDPSLRKSGVGNIFVQNLAKSIDNKQLYDTFSMFGNILSCKVGTDEKRESLGYAFVHYESEEGANQAIQRVDGKVICGQQVSVQHFKSKSETGNNKFKFTNVFVKQLPQEITKEQLETVFSKFGKITSSVINVDKGGRPFAFVNFSSPEEAAAAVEQLNGFELDGSKLFVSRHQKKEEREKELREQFELVKAERQKHFAGVNLYVRNLSDEIDDARLHTEFARFGNITSAKIMRDVSGKPRGFGFVCFSNGEEATKAVTELNGKLVDGKPLYVVLAQRKEARRALLEQQHNVRAKMGGGAGVGGFPMSNVYPQGQMMGFPPSMPPQRQYMYQGMPGMGGAAVGAGMGGVVVGPQGYTRFNGQMQQGGVRQSQGVMNPQMNYMVPMVNGAGVGVRGNMPLPQGQPMIQRQPNTAGQPVHQVGQPGQVGGPRVGPGQVGGPQAGGRPTGSPQHRNQGVQMAGKQQMPQHMMQPNIRYADNVNVRNRAQQPTSAPQAAADVVMPHASEPLTIKALAAAPEELRKQMIGERLFPLIKMQQPDLAGKITGMLLEMDNGELIHLLESPQALSEKINEALQVLRQHPGEAEAAEEETA